MDKNSDQSTHPQIGAIAPELIIDSWVQGTPTSLQALRGDVILVEVFQVNCPGCFIHALPEVLSFHQHYKNDNFSVIGLATAFEDFSINTLDNLKTMLESNEPVGEPLRQLSKADFLENGKLPYTLPFPIAMDKLIKNTQQTTKESIEQFILQQLPDFLHGDYSEQQKQNITHKATDYLNSKTWCPQTFETYQLQGTPSSILIDQQGLLQDVSFGQVNHLKEKIELLLKQ